MENKNEFENIVKDILSFVTDSEDLEKYMRVSLIGFYLDSNFEFLF